MRLRKKFILVLLATIFTTICFLFWNNEFVYSLPTPVPKNYLAVSIGSSITITQRLHLKNHNPIFLHFFNPDCPCSKFNISHFKTLVNRYGNEVTFAIIVMSNKNYSAQQIQKKFGVSIPVLFDPSIAVSCGVYSTPQAVIIDSDQKLYYRGNYNRSRYCTNKKSNYAQLALDSLLHNHTATFDRLALKAYGCQLPVCTK